MIFVWLVVLGSVFSAGYQLFQLFAVWLFFRRARRSAARGILPPVTILKPLKGPGIDLYENLASFCRQDYPAPVQIVFGVEDLSDAAVSVVHRVRRDHPGVDIVLAVGSAPGVNRKVANLRQMMRHAKHGVLVMSDSDIRVGADYLRTLVAPLTEPSVGLTTCLYRGHAPLGMASVVESLFINTDFMPMVLTAQLVQKFEYAYGASIAFKREALEQIGGFGAFADHLADDYELGNRIARAGWRLVLLPYVVETVLDSATFADVWRHQVRWARTYRVCQPAGWFASILTHTMAFGVLAAVVLGGWGGLAMLFGALAMRWLSLAVTLHMLGDVESRRWLWVVPVKDLASTAIWAAAWMGREVEWSGRRLRVEGDGRMVPLGVPAAARTVEAEQLHAAER